MYFLKIYYLYYHKTNIYQRKFRKLLSKSVIKNFNHLLHFRIFISNHSSMQKMSNFAEL